MQGFTEWTYYGAARYRPFGQTENKEGCSCAYVDDQGRLLSTIMWEATPEGIDDARYLATLRKLVEKARASEDPKHKALASQGQRTLRNVLGEIPKVPGVSPEAKLDEWRGKLARQIVRFIRGGVGLEE